MTSRHCDFFMGFTIMRWILLLFPLLCFSLDVTNDYADNMIMRYEGDDFQLLCLFYENFSFTVILSHLKHGVQASICHQHDVSTIRPLYRCLLPYGIKF